MQQVTKGFLDDVVLRDVSLSVQYGDRIGLLGVNGAGKTTLLNLMAGSLAPDEGTVTRAGALRVGYLRQNDALDSGKTMAEEAKEAFAEVYALKDEMEAAGALLAQCPQDEALLERYGTLSARFEAMDGYEAPQQTQRVLNGLGFAGFAGDTPVATLSGGEKMRFAIAKMLLRQPDLLMLDEPTNHLDFSMLGWLEKYLNEYKGAVVVVSHDRYFLDAVAKDIWELERCALSRYTGGYTSFVQQKAERRRAAQKAYDKQQVEIAHMEEYVRKNLARSASASGVGSRVKNLEKMERLPKPPAELKTISLSFDYDVEPFETVLECRGLSVQVGEEDRRRTLYQGLDVTVLRGDKVALVGPNGVGKSTLLKAVQGLVPHEGSVRWGGNTRIGYFDQELAGLDPEAQVMDAVHRCYPAKTEFEIRSALGRLLLGGDDVFKKVKELSGAGRAKVAFAILQMRRANVLLLDEPNNHLDYRAKEVLEHQLRQFTGTLLVVSHDRYFLRRVPKRILELGPAGFVETIGNYDDYLQAREQRQSAAPRPSAAKEKATRNKEPAPKSMAAPAAGYRSKQQRAADAKRRTRLTELEKQISELEGQIEAHNQLLTAPENAADYELLTRHSEQLQTDTAALEAALEEWMALNNE